MTEHSSSHELHTIKSQIAALVAAIRALAIRDRQLRTGVTRGFAAHNEALSLELKELRSAVIALSQRVERLEKRSR